MKFAQQQQSPLQKNLLQSNPLLHQVNLTSFLEKNLLYSILNSIDDYFKVFDREHFR